MVVLAPHIKKFWNQTTRLRVWFHRASEKTYWKGAEGMQERDPDDKSQDAIEQNLKKVYQETLEEEIPDRFVSLLKRLRESESAARDADGPTPRTTSEDAE